MKINKSAFNKKKVQLDDLNPGDLFLFKGSVFMKLPSSLLTFAIDLNNPESKCFLSEYVSVQPLKVKIFLNE